MLRLRLNREIEGALLPAAQGRQARMGTEKLGEARGGGTVDGSNGRESRALGLHQAVGEEGRKPAARGSWWLAQVVHPSHSHPPAEKGAGAGTKGGHVGKN